MTITFSDDDESKLSEVENSDQEDQDDGLPKPKMLTFDVSDDSEPEEEVEERLKSKLLTFADPVDSVIDDVDLTINAPIETPSSAKTVPTFSTGTFSTGSYGSKSATFTGFGDVANAASEPKATFGGTPTFAAFGSATSSSGTSLTGPKDPLSGLKGPKPTVSGTFGTFSSSTFGTPVPTFGTFGTPGSASASTATSGCDPLAPSALKREVATPTFHFAASPAPVSQAPSGMFTYVEPVLDAPTMTDDEGTTEDAVNQEEDAVNQEEDAVDQEEDTVDQEEDAVDQEEDAVNQEDDTVDQEEDTVDDSASEHDEPVEDEADSSEDLSTSEEDLSDDEPQDRIAEHREVSRILMEFDVRCSNVRRGLCGQALARFDATINQSLTSTLVWFEKTRDVEQLRVMLTRIREDASTPVPKRDTDWTVLGQTVVSVTLGFIVGFLTWSPPAIMLS